MLDEVVGGRSPPPLIPGLALPPPLAGIEGEDLVRNADGSVLGGGPASIKDQLATAAVSDTIGNALNIAKQLDIKGDRAEYLRNRLDNMKPDEPELPIILEYLQLADKEVSGLNDTIVLDGQTMGQRTLELAQSMIADAENLAQRAVDQRSKLALSKLEDIERLVKGQLGQVKGAANSAGIAAKQNDVTVTKQYAQSADSALAALNEFVVEAEKWFEAAKGTPAEAQAREFLTKVKDSAKEALGYAITANAVAKVEVAAADIKNAKATAEAAKTTASKEKEKATNESNKDKPDPAVSLAASKAAREAANTAKNAAILAEANLNLVKGTDEEAKAKELVESTKAAAVAAYDAANVAEATHKTIEGISGNIKALEESKANVEAARNAVERAKGAVKAAELAGASRIVDGVVVQDVNGAKKAGADAQYAVTAAQANAARAVELANIARATANEAALKNWPNAAALERGATQLERAALDARIAFTEAATLNVVAQVAVNKVTGPVANLFLAVNAYVTFMVNFMELLKAMLENKKVQGELQLMSMQMIINIAEDSVKSIQREADAQIDNYMTAAICSGVALACSCVSMGMTVKSAFSGREPTKDAPTKPEIPEKPPQAQMSPKASTPQNLKATSDYYKDPKVGGVDTGRNIVDSNGKLVAEYGPSKNWNQGQIDQHASNVRNNVIKNDQGLTQREVDTHNIKLGEDTAAYEAQLQKYDLNKNSSPADIAKKNKEIRAENEKIIRETETDNNHVRARNDAAVQRTQGLGTAFGQIGQHSSEVWKNVVQAANQSAISHEQALRTLYDMLKNLVEKGLNTQSEAFRSNTDMIRELLQQLDSMRQKVNESVAAMLRR